jgi:ferredoxin
MTASSYARRYLVRFEPLGRSVAVSPGTTLLDAAQLAGIGLPSTCHGQGDCCECKVEIMAGMVSRPTDLEETCIAEGNLVANRRLACCTRILDGVQVLVPEDSGLKP